MPDHLAELLAESGDCASSELVLEPCDNRRLAALCGPCDAHLRELERRLQVGIRNRGHAFHLSGPAAAVRRAQGVLQDLYATAAGGDLSPGDVNLALQEAHVDEAANREHAPPVQPELDLRTRSGLLRPRGANQRAYLAAIATHDLNFGIGPAGTGKTYLAVASAIAALESGRVSRLVLVRPAVEAGERLGFLPGDLAQKIDPYLRPLYDALYEFLGFDRVGRLIERNIIEVAPLAYMRGRTLNEAFVILDEAQNTTIEQMRMFLTRLGFGAVCVVTGDITQVDLPREKPSGLKHAIPTLAGVADVGWTWFDTRDIVRHPLVARIVAAYEAHEASK